MICSLDTKLYNKSLNDSNVRKYYFYYFKWENQNRKLHADYHYNNFQKYGCILVETKGEFRNTESN